MALWVGLRPGWWLRVIARPMVWTPVAKLNSVKILVSLAVHFDWPLHQLDVTNVFLHGELREEVYIQQPLGFVDEWESSKVCLFRKFIYIYGLK